VSWPRLLAGGALVALGCGEEESARLEDHRAFHETELTVLDLSLAERADGGESLASWIEVPDEGTDVYWTDPRDDAAPLHRAHIGGFAVQWQISPLVTSSSGYTRLGITQSRAVELLLDPQGELEGLTSLFGFGQGTGEFRLAATTGGVVLLRYDDSSLELWSRAGEAWAVAARLPGSRCYLSDAFAVAPTASGESVAVLVQSAGDPGAQCSTFLHRVDASGQLLASSPVAGSAFDGDGQPRLVIADLVSVPPGGTASLWIGADGTARVYLTGADPADFAFDLDAPTWSADDAVVASPRLLASESLLFVQYRLDEGGVLGPLQAVVVDPASGEVGDPFEWPLDEDECRDAVFVPDGSSAFEYCCVGACQGAGCRTSWLYRGRLVAP